MKVGREAIGLVTVALLYPIVLSTRVDGGLEEMKTISVDTGPEPGPLGSKKGESNGSFLARFAVLGEWPNRLEMGVLLPDSEMVSKKSAKSGASLGAPERPRR